MILSDELTLMIGRQQRIGRLSEALRGFAPVPNQEIHLVESALPEPFLVQRHRNNQVDLPRGPGSDQAVKQHVSQRRGEPGFPLVLQAMDDDSE